MSVSIIIPSYNRPDRLRSCLEALAELEGGPYETIVVDDGSPEPLAPICAEFGENVHCVRQENTGPAKARNVGAAAATGDFLAFTDDDCRPAPDWVTRLLEAQDGNDDRLVGGYVVNLLVNNVYASASQTLCDFLYDYYEASKGNTPFFTTNNVGCSRAGFQKIGGFDESFPIAAAEDRDFGIRWREQGGQLVYVPDAIVGHLHDLSFRRFMRQHSNYGRGAHHLHKVIDQREADTIKFEGLKFYLRLLSYPWTGDRRMRVRQTALMFMSQVAMVGGYVRARLS